MEPTRANGNVRSGLDGTLEAGKLVPRRGAVGVGKEGEPCMTVQFGGKTETIPCGTIRVYPLGFKNGQDGEPEEAEIVITPMKNFDLGAGKGKAVQRTVQGGVAGVIIDTRGRPMQLPTDDNARIAKLKEWLRAMNLPVVE